MLYKYPQAEFPYARLLQENQQRGAEQAEFELLDTGLFDDDAYFDVFVEYAKAAADDILIQVSVHNRGAETAPLSLLPQLCCRNTWSWRAKPEKPTLSAASGGVNIDHPELGKYRLDCEADGDGVPTLLFCENETNARRHFDQPDATGFFKDAFHEYVVEGNTSAVNPAQTGSKAGALYSLSVPAGGSVRVRLRLARTATAGKPAQPFANFDALFARRHSEADHFYADLQREIADADERLVQRQAFAGMIWSKQFFHYDVHKWLDGDSGRPQPPAARKRGRNRCLLYTSRCV